MHDLFFWDGVGVHLSRESWEVVTQVPSVFRTSGETPRLREGAALAPVGVY